MARLLRASLLMLVLFIESLGNAWALPPGISPPPSGTQSAMPCHGQTDQQAEMPCCEEQGHCCDAGCPSTGSAMVPVSAGIGLTVDARPQADVPQPGLLPAHGLRLLRPPAPVES